MIAKITLYNGVVYKIGDKTQDTSDGLYAGRIVDELQIESKMSDKGATPLSLNLTIRNDDNFIPNTVDLWAATIELTATNGNKWVGKINFFDFDADGNVYVTASEKTAPELELQLPDEVRQVYTVDNNFHPSSTSMTIPLVVGGTASAPITLSTILIDKQNGVYLIGTGEIRQILKVYNGSEELPASAYTAYTGTASQSEHAGFAYVKINEAYRKNADGTYAEINVDVIGLKLSSYNAEECRNPARFLYYFLTTPSSGVNGWGCGISASDIDSASFNSAITLCDTLGYKLDGIMWLRQSAQSWIDQICQTMHASYTIGANGKRTLFIDYAGAASKRTFTENDCKVSRYGKNSYSGQVYNKGVLSYGYNPITGLFMQSAQFEDSASVSQIGEQKFVGESYLIGDASTALKVLEYTCKRSLISAEAIEFETDRLETLLKAGDLITLNFPSRNINAVYQIANISTSEYKSSISAVKFDTSVFTVSGSKTNVAWGKDRDITSALTPAQATNLLLSTGFDINPDGTGIPYISGTFDVPAGGWIAAAVQYGVGVNPTNYTELALITEGRFKIQPVSVGTVYTVRIRMITATGHSDYITGQITSAGDDEPPAVPVITANSTEKTVVVKCAVPAAPYDMGGFQIYRKRHSDSVYALIGTVAATSDIAIYTDYVTEYIQYDYKAKSYDRSGNLSDFSSVASVTITGLEATELAATALKTPTGSILNLTAKNCTTASIKTEGGVIDGSGFGHHGQAYGGVSVLDGGEGFEFSNGYIRTEDSFSFENEMTYLFDFNVSSFASSTQSILDHRNSDNNNGLVVFNYPNGAIAIGCRKTGNNWTLQTPTGSYTPNTWHQVACVFGSSKSSIYIDNILVKEGNNTSSADGFLPLFIGRFNGVSYSFAGKLRNIRIYPRALSAVEVKSLYMIPQEAVLSRVTADVIGANAVKSIHLDAGSVTANAVGTNEIIANVANIKDGVITNAKIQNLDAAKLTSGTIAAGRIGAESITSDKLYVTAIRPIIGQMMYRISAKSLPDSLSTGFVIGNTAGEYYGRDLRVIGSLTTGRNASFGKVFSGNATGMIEDKNPFNTINAGASFCAWINIGDTSGERWLFDHRNSGVTYIWNVRIIDGKIRFFTRNNSTANNDLYSNQTILPKTWYFIACVSTGNKKQIYINSVLDAEANQATGKFSNASTYIFGYPATGNSTYLKGSVGNVYFFNRALSAEEVRRVHMLGTDTESGQITADRIATDALKSRNYNGTTVNNHFSTDGTFHDLANGYCKSKYIAWDGAGAYINGYVKATGGSIGDYSIDDGGLHRANSVSGTSSISRLLFDISNTANYANCVNILSTGNSNNGVYVHIGNNTGATSYGVNSLVDSANSIAGYFHKIAADENAPVLYVTAANSTSLALSVIGKAICSSGTWSGSDRNIKSQIKSESVLNRLKQIEITSWKYNQDKIDTIENEKHKDDEKYEKVKRSKQLGATNQPKHFGAMAEEFNTIFGTSDGDSDALCYTDTIGVALRAIQELSAQLDDLKREVRLYKRILNISQEQINTERDNTANRKLAIAQYRQAKHEARLAQEPQEEMRPAT